MPFASYKSEIFGNTHIEQFVMDIKRTFYCFRYIFQYLLSIVPVERNYFITITFCCVRQIRLFSLNVTRINNDDN